MAKSKLQKILEKAVRANSPKRPTPKIKGTNRRPSKSRNIV